LKSTTAVTLPALGHTVAQFAHDQRVRQFCISVSGRSKRFSRTFGEFLPRLIWVIDYMLLGPWMGLERAERSLLRWSIHICRSPTHFAAGRSRSSRMGSRSTSSRYYPQVPLSQAFSEWITVFEYFKPKNLTYARFLRDYLFRRRLDLRVRAAHRVCTVAGGGPKCSPLVIPAFTFHLLRGKIDVVTLGLRCLAPPF
jgi:hypothetical protein